MSKRQLQQQGIFSDVQLGELVEHDENPNLLEHLIEDFQELMADKQLLRNCIEKFIDNVIDEFTLGIIFDVHRKYKSKVDCLEADESGADEESNQNEGFQANSAKNVDKCVCLNCEKSVAPLGFARHLAKCMGVSDNSRSSRIATRRALSNKDKGDLSAYVGVPSDDDDDDEDWNARRNNKKKDKNGKKKNRGTPKKNMEQDNLDPVNVDIEGNYDEITNLRYMMDQGRRSYVIDLQERRSNSSLPADGASTTSRKRDKSKKKNKLKDRGSPSTSLPFD